jgi:hypothetical protein
VAGRKGDYLYKRGDTYWVRFQYPRGSGLKKVQRSTGKKGYDEAWLAVADQIIEHRKFLALYRQAKLFQKLGFSMTDYVELATTPSRPEQKPFTTVENADGTTSFATATEVFVNDAEGNTILARPNAKVVGIKPILLTTEERRDILNAVQRRDRLSREADSDGQIIQAYIDAKGKSKAWADEAEEVYAE